MANRTRDLRVRVDRRPLAHQVADALLTYVAEQELSPGDSLPSEPDLAQMFGVGRSTIRETMMQLENEGVVRRRQGFGTVLTGLAGVRNVGLEVLEPIEARAHRSGWDVAVADVHIETIVADDELAGRLMVDPSEDLIAITRTLRTNAVPLAVIKSFVNKRIPSAAEAMLAGHLAELLFDPSNAAYAHAALYPTIAEGDVARRLEVDDGTPVLRIEQLIVGPDDLPRDWSEQWIATDRLRVDVLRRPPRQRLPSGSRGRKGRSGDR